MQWIINEEREYIVEFVRGLFAGIAVAGKTREEALGNEYRFNWNSDIEVVVSYHDVIEEWQVMAYQCNDYSQFFGNESAKITIGEEWQ